MSWYYIFVLLVCGIYVELKKFLDDLHVLLLIDNVSQSLAYPGCHVGSLLLLWTCFVNSAHHAMQVPSEATYKALERREKKDFSNSKNFMVQCVPDIDPC